jgi:hypothetical protein
MNHIKKLSLFLSAVFLLGMCIPAQAQQTLYQQSLGPVASLVACTAATGVATSLVNTPCGGQGSMFQNSLVLTHTLTWTVVATVSTCTMQLEQATTANGTYTLLGTAQTCTASGTYTATLNAPYVRVNITALTTTGSGTLTFFYTGQIGQPPANILSSIINCGTAPACVPAFQASARVVYGSCLAAAATTCTVTAIAPAFASTTSYFCNVTDATTAANNILKVANASGSSFVITDANSSSDVFNYVCVGT